MMKIPIGQRESQTLEFKAAEALKKPFVIARAAVAMLNSAGGEIWIGIREQDGVATTVEGVSSAEDRKLELLNHLLDVIRPPPRHDELQARVVDAENGRTLLVVHLQPDQQRSRPYALRRDGALLFVTRIDHRVRPMTDAEIFATRDGGSWVRDELNRRRDIVLKKRRSQFWFGIQPDPKQQIDLQDPELSTLLSDPTRSGNRRGGWSFGYPSQEPVLKADRVMLGSEQIRLVAIYKHGGIDLTQPLEQLGHGVESRRQIYPLALLEYVISMSRLAAKTYGGFAAPGVGHVFFDVALTGGEGWTLPAYPPGTHGYELQHEPPRSLDDGTLALPEPHRTTWDELRENPDLVGFRIVRAVYQEFGLREDRIPTAYDRKQQRLLLTD